MMDILKPTLWAPGIHLGHPLTRGLVGCWLANSGSGDRLPDLSGHVRHLWFMNGPTWGAGRIGNAVVCNGSDHYLIADGWQFENDYSVAVWIEDWGPFERYGGIYGKKDPSGYTAFSLQIWRDWGSLRVYHGTRKITIGITKTDIISGLHCIIITYRGDVLRAYHNGEMKTNQTHVAPPSGDGDFLLATNSSGMACSAGKLHAVFAYNRGLAPGEAFALSEDPWQFLCSETDLPIWVGATSGARNPWYYYAQERAAQC